MISSSTFTETYYILAYGDDFFAGRVSNGIESKKELNMRYQFVPHSNEAEKFGTVAIDFLSPMFLPESFKDCDSITSLIDLLKQFRGSRLIKVEKTTMTTQAIEEHLVVSERTEVNYQYEMIGTDELESILEKKTVSV